MNTPFAMLSFILHFAKCYKIFIVILHYFCSGRVQAREGRGGGEYMVVSLFASIVHCSDNCLHYSPLSSVSPFGILYVFTTFWISHENIFINLLLALLLWSVRMSQTQVGFSPVNRRHIGRHFSKLHKKTVKNFWSHRESTNYLTICVLTKIYIYIFLRQPSFCYMAD